jgi:hypothetical protein
MKATPPPKDTHPTLLGAAVVVFGMPDEQVLSYYGEPEFRHEIVFEAVPAQVWGIQVRPGRIELVTLVRGKVVQVRG